MHLNCYFMDVPRKVPYHINRINHNNTAHRELANANPGKCITSNVRVKNTRGVVLHGHKLVLTNSSIAHLMQVVSLFFYLTRSRYSKWAEARESMQFLRADRVTMSRKTWRALNCAGADVCGVVIELCMLCAVDKNRSPLVIGAYVHHRI